MHNFNLILLDSKRGVSPPVSRKFLGFPTRSGNDFSKSKPGIPAFFRVSAGSFPQPVENSVEN